MKKKEKTKIKIKTQKSKKIQNPEGEGEQEQTQKIHTTVTTKPPYPNPLLSHKQPLRSIPFSFKDPHKTQDPYPSVLPSH